MILGDVCTRACAYCAVSHGRPAPVDAAEPARVANAVHTLGLNYVVITSVDRDDLARRRRVDFRGHDPPDARADADVPHRSADSRFPGKRKRAAHGARRAARRAEPQHRDGAAPLPDGAIGRTLRTHAGTARARAPLRAGHPDEDRRDGRPRRGARRARRDVQGSRGGRLPDPDDRPVSASVGRARADGPLLPSRRVPRSQAGRARPRLRAGGFGSARPQLVSRQRNRRRVPRRPPQAWITIRSSRGS